MNEFKKLKEAIELLDKDEQFVDDKGKAYQYIDTETEELLPADEVDPETMQRVEKRPDNSTKNSKYTWDDDPAFDSDYEDDLEASHQIRSIEGGMRDRIISDFGDIAGGGGDPVDWVMNKYGVSIEQIDDLAQEQGYIDANDWTEDILNLVASYNMDESTDLSRILSLSGISKK